MKKTNFRGGFFYCLLINLGFNIMYSVPAWILLALHFWLGLPIWLFWLALGIWVGGVILWMLIIRWARKCGDEPTPYQENKNPYSAKHYKAIIKESDKNDSENKS
ncbi:MAG: hypothetical protein IJ346_08050 [Clostridia bacterium]|nr:hypothetical protein [Clostridia bacterium]